MRTTVTKGSNAGNCTRNTSHRNVCEPVKSVLGVTVPAVILVLLLAFLLGFVLGYKQGAQYTYDSVYLLFTNSIYQASTSLDCRMTNDSLTIAKRPAPMTCCYPSNCPQAKNNPKSCDCEYTISCFGGIGYDP